MYGSQQAVCRRVSGGCMRQLCDNVLGYKQTQIITGPPHQLTPTHKHMTAQYFILTLQTLTVVHIKKYPTFHET